MQELNIKNKIQNQGEDSIDIKIILFKLINAWPLLLFSVIITLLIAFLINHYSKKLYEVKSVILINTDENTSTGIEPLMTAIGYYSPRLSFENELVKLKSYTLTKRTLDNMDFNVSYFVKGLFKSSELYPMKFFKVIYDSTHTQIVNGKFTIVSQDKNDFKLRFPRKGSLYNYSTGELSNRPIKLQIKSNKKLYSFGRWIEEENYRFKIELLEPSEDFFENRYTFVFHDKQSLIKRYNEKIKIDPKADKSSATDVILIDPTPKKAETYINGLCKQYFQMGLKRKNQVAENTLDFIFVLLTGIEDSLSRIENSLQRFKTDNKLINMTKEGSKLYNLLYLTENRYYEQLIRGKYYDYLNNYLGENNDFNALVAPSSLDIRDPLLIELIANLSELYIRKNSLRINLKDQNPQVKEIDARIVFTRKILSENLNNIIRNSKILLFDLQQKIKSLEKEILAFPITEQKLIHIERKFKLNEELYLFLMQKKSEIAISKASNMVRGVVIDPATTIDIPVNPKPMLNYSIALIMAFLLPSIYLFGKDYLNLKIRTREEIERATNIPIAGEVLHSNKNTNLIVVKYPRSNVTESFRILRANLKFLQKDQKEIKSILITSSIPGEGKTFNSINLASVFASSGRKTLLLGTDLRKPKIYSDFGLTNEKGLSSYLAADESLISVIQATSYSHLDIMSSGPIPPNPSELILNEKFNDMLQQLKNIYDYVVLDAPPIGMVADAVEIMKIVDYSFYIVRCNYTHKQSIQYINDKYESKYISNVAIIINDLKVRKGYGYGYLEDD